MSNCSQFINEIQGFITEYERIQKSNKDNKDNKSNDLLKLSKNYNIERCISTAIKGYHFSGLPIIKINITDDERGLDRNKTVLSFNYYSEATTIFPDNVILRNWRYPNNFKIQNIFGEYLTVHATYKSSTYYWNSFKNFFKTS